MRTGGVRAGAILLALLVFVAVAAPLLAPYDPDERSGRPFDSPSPAHPLGTNDVGQDLLSELLFGARVSLGVGTVAALAATALGALVGICAGYRRGWVDAALMRAVDVVLALPVLPLTIVVGVFAGPGLGTQIAVIAAVIWAPVARELRAQVLSLRERDHIAALRAMGAPTRYLMPHHIWPAVFPLVVPQFVLATKTAIGLEAALAFLGLGDPTTKSWGTTLSIAYARSAFLTDAWLWWVLPPGLAIAATVLAFALIGHGLEDRACRLPARAAATTLPPATGEPCAPFPPLHFANLSIGYRAGSVALEPLTLTVESGEILALVGDSGSGKSTALAAACGLLPPGAQVRSGRVYAGGVDVLAASPATLRRLRGRCVALVPQEAMSALNPVRRVRSQLVETVRAHPGPDGGRIGRAEARARAGHLLDLVGLDRRWLRAYPHELSGGMRQRVAIALALAADPAVLLADEPTSGLDVVIAAEILDLLARLRRDLGLAILLVSHDATAVRRIADRALATTSAQPARHAAPPGPTPARPAPADHRGQAPGATATEAPAPLLSVRGLSVTFRQAGRPVYAVRDVDLDVGVGEVVGLVGESGAGKSSVARAVMGLVAADGRAELGGIDVLAARPRAARAARRAAHLVFQDPYASLPPSTRVVDVVAEPLRLAGVRDRDLRRARAGDALAAVRLDPEVFGARLPRELSGGERQRVALARALVARPRLVVADEPTQMLDAALRLEVVDLLEELRHRHGLSVLFVTHDLALARRCCDRIVVMRAGAVVERGRTADLLAGPTHPYTAALVAAAFPDDPRPDDFRSHDFRSEDRREEPTGGTHPGDRVEHGPSLSGGGAGPARAGRRLL
ncbi:MAG: ATP-binding cassette domain-containing protein [Sporichthyaceae bacterium]